jgi:hypothetical protein
MNRAQKERKLKLRRKHRQDRKEAKAAALVSAEYSARCIGKNGKKLKKRRDGEEFDKALVEAMEARGYLPNGKGGWRRRSDRSKERAERSAKKREATRG